MAERRRRGRTERASQILDVAERLAQTRGYNGFSYADVAVKLKITTASLHYHFAGKADLGEALIERYRARFAEELAAIDARACDAPAKLDAYATLYADVLGDQRMCLCGMLAAEYRTLPTAMQKALIRFFDENEAWLTRVLEDGQQQATLQFVGTPSEAARLILSALEGAMLVARPYGDVKRFRATASRLLESLTAPAVRSR
jgi:TetR/AcrR family transcriptional repressor of nem operon